MAGGFCFGVAVVALAAFLGGATAPASAKERHVAAAVKISAHDIGGVVTSSHGPEAGVWVIAETSDLPTRFIRIVVTDDKGRYVLPDLPEANYRVWTRGYGLVDSPKMHGVPGKILDLTAVVAPTAAEAAHYYPAIYWYSMLKIPDKGLFDGKHDIPANVTQQDWLLTLRNRDCVGCHQLGQEATRTLPAAFSGMSTVDAWMRRVQSGQAAPFMVNPLAGRLGGAPFKYFAAWTDGIAKGELPHAHPPRPQGVERDVVITAWAWASDHTYLHDAISTDKRNPTVNAYGLVFGSPEYSSDDLPILDPKTNRVSFVKARVRDPDMPESLGPGNAALEKPNMPSAYWGDRQIWSQRINNHNQMFDEKGRLWLTAAVRAPNNEPAYCKKGSPLVSAQLFPLEQSHRQLAMLDPKTMKYTFIDTCFETHHLQFGFDKDDTLWTSGGGPVIGWLNTKKFEEVLSATGDASKAAEEAQGWSAFILDTNGNGKRDAYVEPNQPVDPTKDKRIAGSGLYAIMPSPVDDSVWGTVNTFAGVGGIVHVIPGANPPATMLTEFYKVPLPGYGPRGGDIDSKGVVWVSLGSGDLGSFDRRKCKGPLNGPKATGDQCPEGWTFYQYPGPGFAGIGKNSSEASYYTWVDQHDALGLGKDVPISTGNENDALLALVKGKWVVLRVPYPLSFYAKGMDGRIDDPNAGWKGRGVWTTSGDRTPWLKEGGKGTTPLVFHFQVRPTPLAD
ncbi:MAG TPA: carboxypeptidase-like regulatory domain-containing protein [Stellaceae bacterium]|nr:carboxypeptidase-like regulatory domain-containing protein [Stellaceae bacterium]